jgi:tRNA(Ile)-lysidine synthase
MALLHWLVQAGYRNLVVCHLNHQLRGRSSTADARLVEKVGARYGLIVEIGVIDVKGLAAKRKLSIETAARAARYAFFAQTAKPRRCRTIFLAHHADDLVETFLINLFRGAGSTGLSSMREKSLHRLTNVELQVIRPLLGSWQTDIDRYVRQHRVLFRDDASNKQLGPLRNRIRLRVIPYLEKAAGKGLRQNIWRTAMILAEEEQFFRDSLRHMNVDSVELVVKGLRKMGVALQRRTLHTWLRAADIANVGFDIIERVRGLLDSTASAAKTNLPGDRHVRRRAGKLFIE